jgi:hypothetical protein
MLTGKFAVLYTLLAAGLGALGSAWRIAQPILEKVDSHAKSMESRSREVEQDLVEKRDDLAQHEREAAGAEAAYAASEAEAARFRGRRPEQVLEFFLGESREVRALEDELGTVSRVRRAFEELNSIMIAMRAAQKRKRQKPLTMEEERLLEDVGEIGKIAAVGGATARGREDAVAGGGLGDQRSGNGHLPAFDRIVIYIDDLDRCRAEQVVKVLEAVHLLLAFPLFVVVVGVDPRWLVNSLKHFYKTELGSSAETEDGGGQLSAVPKEYLEKIFQIPVNLRALTVGHDGTYQSLIESIAGPREQAEDPHEDGDPSAATAGKLFSIHPLMIELPAEEETIEEKIERVALQESEIGAMTAVGPLAGRSPRAVKRLVNVYRFVRGLQRGESLDVFLHGPGGRNGRPRYPGVLFWLALDSGMPAKQVQRMRGAVLMMDGKKSTIRDLMDPATGKTVAERERVAPAARKKLAAFWKDVAEDDRDDYLDALENLEKALPGPPGFAVLQDTLEETMRFSLTSLRLGQGC